MKKLFVVLGTVTMLTVPALAQQQQGGTGMNAPQNDAAGDSRSKSATPMTAAPTTSGAANDTRSMGPGNAGANAMDSNRGTQEPSKAQPIGNGAAPTTQGATKQAN